MPPKRRVKAAARPGPRPHGNRHRRATAGGGNVFPAALKGLLPDKLFDQDGKGGRVQRVLAEAGQLGRAKALYEGVQSLLPASEAAKKAQADEVSEHTTTLEMKRFAIEGDLSRVTVAEEPAAFMNLFRQLTDLSHMTSTAPVRSPERERKKEALRVTYSTADTAAPNHRSLVVVSSAPGDGQRTTRGSPRRTGGRRRYTRRNAFLETCMFVLSAVVMILLLPTLAVLMPYLRHDNDSAQEADAVVLETLAPVLSYELPREQASHCGRRRSQAPRAPSTAPENMAANSPQTALRLPVIRRRRLVCLYKAAVDTISLINDLFSMCTDVVYGQFYVDKKGPSSKQPALDAKLPDKSRYAHGPRTLGWLGGELSDAGDFSRLASPSARNHVLEKFAQGFTAWIESWSFDGAHVDWRYPGGPCQVADDVTRFVTMLQTLRIKTRLLSVGLPYDETMLTARFKVNKISSLADMVVVGTDETLADDFTGQPSCAGRPLAQVAASLWRVGRMTSSPQQSATNYRAQICHAISLASVVYYRRFVQPQASEKGCVS
ncbi:uncharacterized protein LOC144101694 [Amblyomma americanum]